MSYGDKHIDKMSESCRSGTQSDSCLQVDSGPGTQREIAPLLEKAADNLTSFHDTAVVEPVAVVAAIAGAGTSNLAALSGTFLRPVVSAVARALLLFAPASPPRDAFLLVAFLVPPIVRAVSSVVLAASTPLVGLVLLAFV